MKVYICYKQGDMTEGRDILRPMPHAVFATEQAAWDYVNSNPGICGRHPAKGTCWPSEKCKEHDIRTWQEYKERLGYTGDYNVIEEEVREG